MQRLRRMQSPGSWIAWFQKLRRSMKLAGAQALPHYASSKFWALYADLPREVREIADKNYDASYTSSTPISAFQAHRKSMIRACRHLHRALGVELPDGILWFWIGTHGEYDASSSDSSLLTVPTSDRRSSAASLVRSSYAQP
jgi:hypothetical protein